MRATKSNPYHLGYEDGMRGLKKNPYLQGTIQWLRYWNGQEAARQVRSQATVTTEKPVRVEAGR